MSGENSPPDGGFRAVAVVISSFLCNGLIFGLVNSYSVLFKTIHQVLEENGVTNASSKASLIGSLTIGTTFFLSMFAGMLSDRIGIRRTTFIGGFLTTSSLLISSFFTHQKSIKTDETGVEIVLNVTIHGAVGAIVSTNCFYGLKYEKHSRKPLLWCLVIVLIFSYGILFGIGASLTYVPSLTIIGHYYKKYIGIANGFVTLGSSLFSVAMPYILKFLISSVGLNQCLRYIGALLSLLMLCALVFKPTYKSPVSKKRTDTESAEAYFANFINLSIWKNERYVIWVIAVPIALCGYFVPFVYMVPFVELNFGKGKDENLPLICIAITSGLGRIIFGPLSDYKKIDSIFLQQLSFLMIGAVTILIPLTSSYVISCVLSLILGLFDGCFISVIGPIAFQFCGPKGATQAIGFILGLSSFPLIIGPPIAGWLFDNTKSYTLPFVLAGIPPILGALLLTKIHFIKPSEGADPNWVTDTKMTEEKGLTSEAI